VRRRHSWCACAAALGLLALGAAATAAPPPVRTITAFIDLDAADYAREVRDAAARLHRAQRLFEAAGYSVQTVRITTQPFMQYAGSLPRAQALALFSGLAALSKSEQVLINIGPAVLDDHPDAAALSLLEEVHSRGLNLNSSMIIAGEDGIHWNTVRAAAHHVAVVAARSEHSQGSFAFAATAMLAPGTPFFPGSYHLGQTGRFALGLQSVGAVAQVLAHAHGDAPAAVRELTAVLTGYAQDLASRRRPGGSTGGSTRRRRR
jgi:uncharacterized protein (UPF0210 family)